VKAGRPFRSLLLLAPLLAPPLPAADPPKFTGLHPAGIAVGSEAVVEAIGSTVWPVKTWCSVPSLKVEPTPDKGKLKITAPAEAPLGPALIRFYTAHGASDARIFLIGSGPELLEIPKNDRPEEAQAIPSLPVTINGILERRHDIDFFRLPLKRGQTLSARLDAYTLRTDLDAFLILLGPDGRELVLASDTHTIDPAFETVIPTTGDYLLQVNAIPHKASAEVAFAGDKDKVYRLHLATTPLETRLPKADSFEAKPQPPLKAPHRLQGILTGAGERDRFRIEAAAGSKWRVRVEARAIHLITDPVLRILKADGSLLREVDDSNAKPDPVQDITMEAAGFCEAEVRDRFGRPGQVYQLVVEPIVPSFRSNTAQDSLIITGGKSVDLTVNLTREDGHAAALELLAPDLPAGVTWKAEAFPAKTGPFKVTFTAAATAAAFQGPIHLQLKETGSPRPPLSIVKTWQTEESRGDYWINETADLWLTVVAVPPPAAPAPPVPAATK
jgi:hypothetical protein